MIFLSWNASASGWRRYCGTCGRARLVYLIRKCNRIGLSPRRGPRKVRKCVLNPWKNLAVGIRRRSKRRAGPGRRGRANSDRSRERRIFAKCGILCGRGVCTGPEGTVDFLIYPCRAPDATKGRTRGRGSVGVHPCDVKFLEANRTKLQPARKGNKLLSLVAAARPARTPAQSNNILRKHVPAFSFLPRESRTRGPKASPLLFICALVALYFFCYKTLENDVENMWHI